MLVAFFAGQSVLAKAGLGISFGQPGVARAVLGSALYLAVAGVLGLGLGALLRSTAAAVTALFGLLFGLQLLAGLIPGATGVTLEKFMPSTAGQAIASVHPDPGTSLGPWAGLGPVRRLHRRRAGPGRPADEPRRRVTGARSWAAATGARRPATHLGGRPSPSRAWEIGEVRLNLIPAVIPARLIGDRRPVTAFAMLAGPSPDPGIQRPDHPPTGATAAVIMKPWPDAGAVT